MQDARLIGRLRRKFQALAPVLDERARRHWAATEAAELPRGGVSWVAAATGLSRTTILAGMRELRDPGRGSAPPGGYGGRAAGDCAWRWPTLAWKKRSMS